MPLDRRHDHPTLALAALLLSCHAASARGQTSADLSFVSEYAGRGVALYDRPALQLRVEHDFASGWYGGAFASPVSFEGRNQAQLIAYGGHAQRLGPNLSWDAGATRATFSRDGGASYHEFYVGLSSRRASARLFYAPAYYGEGRTVYLDLSGAYPINDAWRLTAHVGLLHPFGDYDASLRDSGDLRLAVVGDIGDYTLQAGWQARWRTYLPEFPRPRAFSVSVSRHF